MKRTATRILALCLAFCLTLGGFCFAAEPEKIEETYTFGSIKVDISSLWLSRGISKQIIFETTEPGKVQLVITNTSNSPYSVAECSYEAENYISFLNGVEEDLVNRDFTIITENMAAGSTMTICPSKNINDETVHSVFVMNNDNEEDFFQMNCYTPKVLLELLGISGSAWATKEIAAANGWSLINFDVLGTEYTNPITRRQFCDVVVNYVESFMGEELQAADADTFSDCSDESVLKAYKAGIVNGVGNGTFAPDAVLDRQTLATMLSRAIKYAVKEEYWKDAVATDLSCHSDSSAVADWAKEGVALLSGLKIMNGNKDTQGNNVLMPTQSCTIEQCLAMTVRAIYF